MSYSPIYLYDQRIDRFRLLYADAHEIVEDKARERVEELLDAARYKDPIRAQARIFIAWISGVRRDQDRPVDEAKMLVDMVQKRERAIAERNMEALRVYADIVRIGAEVAAYRVKLIDDFTREPFKVIGGAGTTKKKRRKARRAAPDLLRVV